MSTKLLTIVVTTHNRAAQLAILLNQLVPQVTEFGEDVNLVVMDDRSTDNTSEVVSKHFPYARYEHASFRKGVHVQRCQAYALDESKYVWVIGDDDQVADNAVAVIVSHLKQAAPAVLILNRMTFVNGQPEQTNVLGLAPTAIKDYAGIGELIPSQGFYGGLSTTSHLVCEAACHARYWLTLPVHAPQVYMFLRRFHSRPVRVLGLPLIEQHISPRPVEEWQLAAQVVHQVCLAIVENYCEGVDWRPLVQKCEERFQLRGMRGWKAYDYLQGCIELLWSYRRPLRGETLLAFSRLYQMLAIDERYFLHLNRAAELCPGCTDMFHYNMSRLTGWIADIVAESQSQDSILPYVVQEHPAMEGHPFGFTINTHHDLGALELTQREMDCLEQHLYGNLCHTGIEFDTQLGLSAMMAAKTIKSNGPGGRFVSFFTDDFDDTYERSALQLQHMFGLQGDWSIERSLVTFDYEKIFGNRKLDYVFINGAAPTPERVKELLELVQPHLADEASIVLRGFCNREDLLNIALQALGTSFVCYPGCQHPWGYGLAIAKR